MNGANGGRRYFCYFISDRINRILRVLFCLSALPDERIKTKSLREGRKWGQGAGYKKRGQLSVIRGQRTEGGGQRTGGRGQRAGCKR